MFLTKGLSVSIGAQKYARTYKLFGHLAATLSNLVDRFKSKQDIIFLIQIYRNFLTKNLPKYAPEFSNRKSNMLKFDKEMTKSVFFPVLGISGKRDTG